ncbi:MAG: hypothetical protein WKG03_01315 [Telluria sp.]
MAEAPRPPVLPVHCTVVIGLPCTRQGFERSLRGSDDAYARQYPGGWDQYCVQWLTPMSHFARAAQSLHVNLVPEASPATLKASFNRPDLAVVEMAGGFASVRDLVDMVPDRFDGVLDLCICHPDGLAAALVREKPACLVRFKPRKVSPLWWLHYFEGLFHMLASGKFTYAQAYELINLELAERMTKNGLRKLKA